MSVTEPPLDAQVLETAGEALVADERRDRRIGILEQRVQRADRDRERARDRRRPEVRLLQMRAHVAADIGPDRGALGGAAGRQPGFDRGPQELERGRGGRGAGRRLEPGSSSASAFM